MSTVVTRGRVVSAVRERQWVSSVFLGRSQVDLRKLKRNGVIVAEALARFMYGLSDKVNV